jgi:CRISPR-associated protein Cas1
MLAKAHGLAWRGRIYNQDDWFEATAANRALSAANACLYGVCHAAIVSAGYSAGIGFIHTGKMLSFVYDVGDFYKTEVTVPVAFRLAATVQRDLEREVRMECRKAMHEAKLKVTARPPSGYVLQVWSSPTPQGFSYRQYGTSSRHMVDFEGMALIVRAGKPGKERHT